MHLVRALLARDPSGHFLHTAAPPFVAMAFAKQGRHGTFPPGENVPGVHLTQLWFRGVVPGIQGLVVLGVGVVVGPLSGTQTDRLPLGRRLTGHG